MAANPASAFSLINGGFESPDIATSSGGGPDPNYPTALLPDSAVPGWETTATDNNIEIWKGNTFSTGLGRNTPPAYEGTQYAELNGTQNSALFQDVTGITLGSLVGYELAHRGRDGLDTMRLTITDLGGDNASGGGNDTVLFTRDFTSGASAWSFYSQGQVATALGNKIRFSYAAISSSSGCNIPESCGNLIDAASFGVNVGNASVPAPLPLLGAGVAFGFSRRLRKRLLAASKAR